MSNVSDLHEPLDLTPSATQVEVPHVTRALGMLGLFLLTIGTASVIAAEHYNRGPLGAGYGYLAGMLGLAALLIHALRDSDVEIRRMYGGLGLLLLVVGVAVSVWPGAETRKVGEYLLPYGFGFGAAALFFLVPFLQHETDPKYRAATETLFLGVGGLLIVGSMVYGLIVPDALLGSCLLLSLLGLGYLCAFLSHVDSTVGRGYQVAVALGVVGAVAVAVAFGRSIVPSVLNEGPAAVRNAAQGYDTWKLGARLASILLSLGVAGLGLVRALPLWFRSVAVVAGLALAGVLITGTFTKAIAQTPGPFLIPYGLILAAIGLLYLAVSAAVLTDNQFVVLTRRELAAYFFSPIAYLVLFGIVVIMGIGYVWFILATLSGGAGGRPVPIPEPIVQGYPSYTIISAFLIVLIVPALTMRLLSEEQRGGTLEVLLTAPVNESTIVLSKFTACWIYFMLCWLPGGLYLVALRIEGGVPFDYRPILSYYIALGCCAAAFTSVGLFFSSLTRNQIVAAVLTGTAMFAMVLTAVLSQITAFGAGLRAVLGKFDVLRLWESALAGQLPVTTVVFQLSLAVFFLFLTVKVLEVRKWS